MKLTPILKLVRLSALPSAWADQFGGMALAAALVGTGFWRFEPWKIALLLPMSFGVYLGGMALNDVLHVRKDRLLQKPRPLATGKLTLTQGWAVTLSLFTIGIICGFAVGCGEAVLALIALIFLYNHLAAGRIRGVNVEHPKSWTVVSVAVIAACRAIHVLLPLMAHTGATKLPALMSSHAVIALFAASVFAYFCLVTIVSLFEDTGGGRRAVMAVSLLLVPVVLVLPAYVLSRPGTADSPILGIFAPLLVLVSLLMMLWRKLDAARHDPIPPKLGACVGAGIRGEALLMCGFALMLAHDQPWWGLLALACYPVGSILGKWISPT